MDDSWSGGRSLDEDVRSFVGEEGLELWIGLRGRAQKRKRRRSAQLERRVGTRSRRARRETNLETEEPEKNE